MLEFIWSIPEEIGWVLVGFVACLDTLAVVKLVKLIIQLRKPWWQNEEEDC